ncbi:SHOCT domain-containing protein [Cryobacterium sp. MDB1-18-2]|uniref:SHOCT domain-containing protein n=1 Tax=unclassified Cryobacterium TaxID=2649013 RepID=UPI00106A82E7|nr:MULTISPECIES: SHOCT domain-containing protein [unclassified Cryobacterium]TFC08155.1 SHOCT domain-containing protein [Cryobacterium sp. MDB2-33-2]TFC30816.1 SHOCT domain-containing protein [Cryobacterium sp. MDB1-18-2]TFC38159.1 SHOCT domain-containing protein [Cryobacterium sp. MDB1-18-1]
MMWGNGINMAWGWPFGLLVIVGIVLLVIWAVRSGGGSAQRNGQQAASMPDVGAAQPSKARLILDERFAAGDLSAEQYREQLKVLGIPTPGVDEGNREN